MLATVSQVDSVAPGPADIAAGVMTIALLLGCFVIAVCKTIDPPARSIPKADDKEAAVPAPPRYGDTTYYHVTTPENAAIIMATGTMKGSTWEGGYVYAFRNLPDKYAIENSGAHFGVVISFKTNQSFTLDTGISDPYVLAYGPVVSTSPGPIIVWDVQIVGG